MSIRIKEKVTCPKCGFQYEIECAPAVDGAKDPDLKERLLSGDAFVTVCPSCSVTTRLVYPVMYHDPGRGFAVYFLPRVEQEKLERDDTLNGLLDPAASYSRLRLVDDYSHLCEKIRLFELGLNDRAMELFKACTALSMMGQEKTDAFVPDSMVFEEESEGRMRFTCARGEENKQLTAPAGFYHTIVESAPSAVKEGGAEQFVMIDMLWALNALKDQNLLMKQLRDLH